MTTTSRWVRWARRWRWPALGCAVLAAAVLMVGLVVAPAASTTTGDGAVVRTDAGAVRGTVAEDYRRFQGIPYAAPPVGGLRWKAPQPVEPWSGVRDATRPGDRCAQNPDQRFGFAGSRSEDCLYLDVTAPRPATPEDPRPVMVWLHGGGLVNGAGGDHDARRLAVRGDVVVVTVNYRLGIFGFLSHPALEDSDTLGFADQQAALRWVQANAAAFGGDPGNVTLFGESAGAESTCTQLASPSAAGLFHRVVTQSAPCTGEVAGRRFKRVLDVPLSVSRQEADAFGLYLAGQLGCADPADAGCLRRLSTEELLRVPVGPRPVYGTSLLPEDPQAVLRQGRFHKVPVLSGITRDEGTMWVALIHPEPFPAARYRQLLREFFGGAAPAVARRYPLHAYTSPRQAWAAIMSDREHAGPEQDTIRLFARHVPTYAYEFTDLQAPPALRQYPPDLPPGASHGSEVNLLLPFNQDPAPLTPAQQELADRMIAYWANFAHHGDPGGDDLPAWPQAKPGGPTPHVQALGPGPDGIRPFDRTAEHKLAFWSTFD